MALSRKLWLCQGLTDPRERLEVALRECFYDLGNLPKEMVRQEWDGPSPDLHERKKWFGKNGMARRLICMNEWPPGIWRCHARRIC